MENKFDKEIQELFKAYKEQPSVNCWDKVSSQLDAMPEIVDASQGFTASSANTSAFSQFAGSVVGKITIAITSVAAIGGLSYLIATSDSQDKSLTTIDTASNVEVLAEDKSNKEDNIIATIIEQPEASNEIQKPKVIQKDSVSQKKQQIHKEENKNINSPNSVLENNQIPQNQPVITQVSEKEAKSQSKETEKQQTVKPQQEKKETPKNQKINQEQPDISTEIQKEETINGKPSIDVSKIPISNLLTPNGDGYNDYFIVGNIDEFPENNLVVFRRDGRVVYEKTNYHNEWDADNIPDGVYFYMFSFIYERKTFMRQGSITIKR